MVKNEPSKDLLMKLKAIENIVKELEMLAQEDREDVINFALKQVGISQTSLSNTRAITGKDVSADCSGIDKFVSSKKPADQYQRVAVLAYYLQHCENIKEFKNKEIAEANLRAKQSKIGNMSDVVSKAETRYKFLTKGISGKTRQISTLGENIVETLPDQDKVKTIIESSKKGKRRKKSRKKSKQKK